MMKRFGIVGALVIDLLFVAGCSRKAAQTGPAAPEVLVTTVAPRDVPRVLERVATLDGFINANINAQVQGYIVSRDYQEGSVVKKGDLLFQIDPRPFEAALAQAKGTLFRRSRRAFLDKPPSWLRRISYKWACAPECGYPRNKLRPD